VFWNLGSSYISSASGSLGQKDATWQRPPRDEAMKRPSKLTNTKYRLRKDLTKKERQYVLAELAKAQVSSI